MVEEVKSEDDPEMVKELSSEGDPSDFVIRMREKIKKM